MESVKDKKVLVSGASIAGLSTAYWLNKVGYSVTIIERANEPRIGGAAVNVGGRALDVARRMGIFEQLTANALTLEKWEFKNADDVTEGSMMMQNEDIPAADADIEIERKNLLDILIGTLKNEVDFIFNDYITSLTETEDAIDVTFKNDSPRTFDLVFGCDGTHSGVRKIWCGDEADYAHFLDHYFSLTIVNKLLIEQNTAQMYNVPGKVIMLNAYNNKTDIVFCFFSKKEISYDYRDADQQGKIILEQFGEQSWRTAELMNEVKQAKTAYFDKFCQIKMPSWTKGRVALVGDAGYCASPASGMGGSLAMIGPAALADALEKHNGNVDLAFQEYNQTLRPFIEDVQATAMTMLSDYLVPGTEEGIRRRNAQGIPF